MDKAKEIVAGLKTEMQCFELVEKIGEINFAYRHGVMDGWVEPDEESDRASMALHYVQTLIVEKLESEFGIIFMAQEDEENLLLPPGKRGYWSWYANMKEEYLEMEHKKTLCSACPFCKEKADRYENVVPCKVFRGYANRLSYPWKCLMLDEKRDWYSRREFFEEMEEKAGADAVNVFKQKELRLKLLWSEEKIAAYKRAFEKYGAVETKPLLEFVVGLEKNNFVSEVISFIDYLTAGYPDYFTVYPQMNELQMIKKRIEG